MKQSLYLDKNYSSEDIEPFLSKCIVCNSRDNFLYYSLTRYEENKEGKECVSCDGCDFHITFKLIIDPESEDELYCLESIKIGKVKIENAASKLDIFYDGKFSYHIPCEKFSLSDFEFLFLIG